MSDMQDLQDMQFRTPQEVASRLDISPSTLRRWADEFSDFLSDEATGSQGKSHRRYSEEDLDYLLTVKKYMSDGMTYEQVRNRLKAHSPDNKADGHSSTALVSPEDLSLAAISYLSETIDELRQGQLSVLNSQSANRELMGVLIQDNFNLKEENARLRERSLEMERKIGRLQRDEEARHEQLRQEMEAKLMEVREMASRNPITVLQTRSGCLGGLFGGSSSQVVSPQDMAPPPAPRPQSGPPPRSSYPRPPMPPGPPE